MGMSGQSYSKKDLNFELNLLPVFDILSVCICFLLMTVVWVEVRSLETKQVIGSQGLSETETKESLWISLDQENNLTLSLQSAKKLQNDSFSASFSASATPSKKTYSLTAEKGQIDWNKVSLYLKSIAKSKIEIAQLLPTKKTKYDEIIKLMDLLKQNGFKDIGLSPI